jgi:uncharacterized membrane protein YhaH (DUF805 family)
MEWLLLPLKRYADFSGRSRRKEYWMFVLAQLLVYLPLVVLLIVGAAQSEQNDPSLLVIVSCVLIFLLTLALLVPSIAVAVRRFHDQGKSGWLYLLSLIPWVGGLLLIVFMCIEGTAGANAYGPDPKQN